MPVVIVYFYVFLPLTGPSFFFFNDTATTEIYTLSLHDALPISGRRPGAGVPDPGRARRRRARIRHRYREGEDRKSTRLNSSHSQISYAVFCLKKKKKSNETLPPPLTHNHLHYIIPIHPVTTRVH